MFLLGWGICQLTRKRLKHIVVKIRFMSRLDNKHKLIILRILRILRNMERNIIVRLDHWLMVKI